MLSSILSDIPAFLLRIPAVLLALTVHESAHGYAAYKLGDPTAHDRGRISLNPLKHLDPIGTLMMLLVGFGWARPVPVDARRFRSPRMGMALTALAGPASNLLLSVIGRLVYRISFLLLSNYGATSSAFLYNLELYFLEFLQIFAYLNLSLALFNLIPVPPLDGSRILLVMLPEKYYFGLMKYERYISLALMLLLFLGVLDTPLSLGITYVMRGIDWLIGLLPFI